jgi:hypothetical protein
MYLLRSITFLLIALIATTSFSQSYELDAASQKRFHIADKLNDPSVLPIVKEIYQDKPWKLSSQNADLLSALLDSLPRMPEPDRAFYFVVIAKTLDKADGAYAEALGYAGKEYIDNNLPEFLNYFIGEGKLPSIYLQKWSGIVSNEVELLKVNQDAKILTKLPKLYDAKCKDCRSQQKAVLKEFLDRVKLYVK